MKAIEHSSGQESWTWSLAALVRRMVTESGDPEGFDAEAWTEEWLSTGCLALGGRRPVDFVGTTQGRRMVLQLLAQMQSGAYA